MDDDVAQADISSTLQIPQAQGNTTDGFARQVADYFGSYVNGTLSIDGVPSRRYGDTYRSGLIRRLPLDLYTQLNKNIYKNFVTGLGQQTFVITQNKYTTRNDEVLIESLRMNVLNIDWKKLAPLLQSLASQAEAKRIGLTISQSDAVEQLLVGSQQTLSESFIVPYIIPVKDLDLAIDEKTRHTMATITEAATSRVYDTSKELLRHIYTAYLASEEYISNDALIATLADALTPAYIKDSLTNYIDHLQINDAYQNVYALHRSTTIADAKSMYVYFGELSYDNHVFPLFYTKVASTHTFPSVTLTFDNPIIINKHAIEYVIRQFAMRTNQTVDINSFSIPEIIRSAEEIDELQRIVSLLVELLSLPDDVSVSKPSLQEVTNHFITLSNRLSLYIDASFESTIGRDYEAIVNDSSLYKKVEKYLGSLLVKPSPKYVEEVNEAWDETDPIDKLLPSIPLSINDEQKRVLIALEKASSERIVIDAPNNTGKRHLINATILSVLSKNQSVLVIGNSPESPKRIRKEIGSILRKTSGTQGHNPVLNLQDATILDSISESARAKIEANVRIVDEKASELASAKKRKKQTIKDELARFVHNAENINLHEVEQSSLNERRFAAKDWIDDESIDDISDDMQQLHRSIQYVRASDAGYLMPYIEVDRQKAIEDFLYAYNEYEKANKNVHARLPEFIVRYKKLLPEQQSHLRESLAYIQSNYRQFVKILKDQPASSWLGISESSTFKVVAEQEKVLDTILTIALSANRFFKYSDKARLLHELDTYKVDPLEITEALDTYIEQIATLKSKLFGFSGRMLVVENLNKQLAKSLPSFGLPDPEKQTESMQVMSDFVRFTTHELAAAGLKTQYWKDVVSILLADDDRIDEMQEIIGSLNQTAKYDFAHSFKIHEADNLLANITLLEFATELNRVYREYPKIGKLFGITTINHLLARPHEFLARASKLSRDLNEANQLNDAKQTIKGFVETYPAASKRLGVVFSGNSFEIVDDAFANSDSEFIKEYLAFKKKERDIQTYFEEIVTDSFANNSVEYQQILGVEMQQVANQAFIDALEGDDNDIDLLNEALKEGRVLGDGEAEKLLKLFPCVVSDVKSLAGIMPLTYQLFDLVIIDDADSISIAEVLPSVLRAKKTLIVGDHAQSNINQNPLYKVANDLHARSLVTALRETLSNESADNKNAILVKQETTFIANLPALTFFQAYANYDVSLQKQFGVYEELASFGNKYYYDNRPVSLMSRAVPLAELFTFSKVKAKSGVTRFTNPAEVDRIIKHLHELKEQGFSGSIGIVTPFAEQAALIQKELDECVITDWFERRDLRVMTFDSKRQHERDYTYYSLVASEQFNELSQKLPSTIGFDAFAHDTRSHRLLTGFSGNRHGIHIVHSLPFDAYGGSLSEALKYFSVKLQGPSVAVKGAATDVQMPTDAVITQAFEKSSFAKKNKDRLSFVAKYPFTNYIKPLSPNYSKANYKVFFLVMIDERPLVIEYDDFKERFLQNGKTDKDNGSTYLTAQDAYGYKLLEGYGYQFVRLNKFTIGNDPSETLDTYLNELVRTPTWAADNGFVA